MKGIILAGGLGTRLYPLTLSVCKQLLPVYDKPLIYYPLSVLMEAAIREIAIISTEEDLPKFQRLFGSGEHLGLSLSYIVQKKPEGIAQAFILAESFIGDDAVALILGDNIFYGQDFSRLLQCAGNFSAGAMIFAYEVQDPMRYGVVEFDSLGKVATIIEKPKEPLSPFAVTGLYFYDNEVIEIAKSLSPSSRGELEITDVNNLYLARGALQVRLLDRGFAWLDTGTHLALQQAASYVQTIQERQGVKIGCIEEIAWKQGFIDREQFYHLVLQCKESDYGKYLYSCYQKHDRTLAFSS